jgi:flagellar assembly protein FliH
MPVMKAQAPRRTRESPIVMDLADLELCAAEIVSRARQDAARIVADAKSAAQRETLQIREQARRAGHQEGLQAGLTEGRQQGHDDALAAVSAQLKDLTTRWSQTLDLLHQHMPEHVADARMDLVRLALAIARRITRQEALRDRQVAAAVVEDALRTAGAARRVALQVNPVEVDTLEKYLPDLLAKLRSIGEVELTPDDAVAAGGCLLRFGAGQIDARIETQLDRIAAELLDQKDENSAP